MNKYLNAKILNSLFVDYTTLNWIQVSHNGKIVKKCNDVEDYILWYSYIYSVILIFDLKIDSNKLKNLLDLMKTEPFYIDVITEEIILDAVMQSFLRNAIIKHEIMPVSVFSRSLALALLLGVFYGIQNI